MTTPITDADYTYLNAYVTKISDAKQAYDSAVKDLETAKAVTADAKQAYDAAAEKHAETISDLTIAKANYQKFVDAEKKAAEEAKKAEEAKRRKK